MLGCGIGVKFDWALVFLVGGLAGALRVQSAMDAACLAKNPAPAGWRPADGCDKCVDACPGKEKDGFCSDEGGVIVAPKSDSDVVVGPAKRNDPISNNVIQPISNNVIQPSADSDYIWCSNGRPKLEPMNRKPADKPLTGPNAVKPDVPQPGPVPPAAPIEPAGPPQCTAEAMEARLCDKTGVYLKPCLSFHS
jgi:hypothetical protein